MRTDKASTLRFGGLFKAKTKASEVYRPNELRSSAEAWICLNCPLPECNKSKCMRYEEEFEKIKQAKKRQKEESKNKVG